MSSGRSGPVGSAGYVGLTDSGVWREQTVCPVTGEVLGSRGEPVRVDAVLEYQHPLTVWQRRFPRWFPPKVETMTFTFYVCCPGCVAKAKADPDGCHFKVYADRRGLVR